MYFSAPGNSDVYIFYMVLAPGYSDVFYEHVFYIVLAPGYLDA